jgi:hypothetical protein
LPAATALVPRDLSVDVTSSVGEPAHLAGTYYPPAAPVEGRPVLVCLPGGTYTRGYFDLEVPGHPGYSFAADATARGFPWWHSTTSAPRSQPVTRRHPAGGPW